MVMVGDSSQAIYGWRGARDVMTGFDATHLTFLPIRSPPRRTGQRVARLHRRADPADRHRYHSPAGRPDPLSGRGAVPHQHRCHDRSHAATESRPPCGAGQRRAGTYGAGACRPGPQKRASYLAPRTRSLRLLGRVAGLRGLRSRRPRPPAVYELVDAHGPEAIIAAVDALTDETNAEITVSTAHKVKGREWPKVRIADDFPPPPDSDQKDDSGRAPGGNWISGDLRGSRTVQLPSTAGDKPMCGKPVTRLHCRYWQWTVLLRVGNRPSWVENSRPGTASVTPVRRSCCGQTLCPSLNSVQMVLPCREKRVPQRSVNWATRNSPRPPSSSVVARRR